jgi:hypothetical protein
MIVPNTQYKHKYIYLRAKALSFDESEEVYANRHRDGDGRIKNIKNE